MKKFIFGRPLIQLQVLLVATILCFGVSTASAATPGPAQPQAVNDVSIMSGSWFNPARTYEGFEFQALDNGDFLIIFYTYLGPSDAPGAD